MKSFTHSGKKPWRTFKRNRSARGLVRKACCLILILEAAALISRGGPGLFFVENTRQEWISQVPDAPSGPTGSDRSETGSPETSAGRQTEESGGGILEKVFGIRLRLRDGAIEFDRQEDIRVREEKRQE